MRRPVPRGWAVPPAVRPCHIPQNYQNLLAFTGYFSIHLNCRRRGKPPLVRVGSPDSCRLVRTPPAGSVSPTEPAFACPVPEDRGTIVRACKQYGGSRGNIRHGEPAWGGVPRSGDGQWAMAVRGRAHSGGLGEQGEGSAAAGQSAHGPRAGLQRGEISYTAIRSRIHPRPGRGCSHR